VHLKLWLLLHSRNHTSTLQTSSGWTGAEVAVGVEQAAPPQPSSPRRGAEARKVAAAPPRVATPVLSAEAFEQSAAASAARGGAVRLQRAAESREPPAALHKVSCERPPEVEVGRAGWPSQGVGGSFWAPGDRLCRRSADVECQANFKKLLQSNLRGYLHGRGPWSGGVQSEGNAGRSDQPVTGTFPRVYRGELRSASSFFLPSSAHIGDQLRWRPARSPPRQRVN